MTAPGFMWRDAHDRLREYHDARGRGAARSVLDRCWQSYLVARRAAEAADAARSTEEDA